MPFRHNKPLKDGWNTFNTEEIRGYDGQYTGGTHVFKHKKDAKDWAGWQEFLVPTIIRKGDITTIGNQKGEFLTLVASKAKFNLSKAVRV